MAAPPDLFLQVPPGDGKPGSGAGQLDNPRGMVADPLTGHFYVAEAGNARVSEFTIWGQFVKAWGWEVVASGPGNKPQNEKQEIRVDATSGSFALRYLIKGEGDSGPIAFDASAAEVQTAYEAMAAIDPGSGQDIAVSGPDGGPWVVEFKGNLADTDIRAPRVVKDSEPDSELIGVANAHTLQDGANFEVCVAANGDVCRAGQGGATGGHLGEVLGITRNPAGDLYVFDGRSQRVSKFDPSGEFLLAFGGDVVAQGPSDSAIDEQQKVTVKASGGSFRLRLEELFPGEVRQKTAPLPFNASAAQVDEALEALPAIEAAGGSVAVSGGPGDLTGSSPYLISFQGGMGGDDIPKLEATNSLTGGEALITVETVANGGGVEVCEAGVDVCKHNSPGTATEPGKLSGGFETNLAAGPDGTIYVGDANRILTFNPDGSFKGELPIPEPGTVGSLAADPLTADLYLTYSGGSKPNVRRLNETTGAEIGNLTVAKPGPIAVDSAGNVYVVVDPPGTGAGNEAKVLAFGPGGGACMICLVDNFAEAPPKPPSERLALNGLATNSGCEVPSDHLYVSYFNEPLASFVRGFGPAPQNTEGPCEPPKVAPEIVDQFAVSVDSDGATVRAEINPNFWPDTRYYVEYGTGKCSEGGCPNTQPLPPGSLLTAIVTEAPLPADVLLGDLEPETTYRYRFVAESTGGGPVYGIDPDGEGEAAEASFEEGLEATFTTFPPAKAPPSPDPCPNASDRFGASAFLPDCRALELVSPVDKAGGEISVRPSPNEYPAEHNQAAVEGEKMTYSSEKAFGDAFSAPYTSQYLATRIAGVEWSTHGISPPHDSGAINDGNLKLDVVFKAFTDDLCQGWLVPESDPPLAPGATEDFFNLYRRQNCGTESYEAITNAEPPTPGDTVELQGFSQDGTHTVFRTDGKLTPDAPEIADLQLYENFEGKLRYVCLLPNGEPVGTPCSAGTSALAIAETRYNAVGRAVSGDGSRIFWSRSSNGPAPLYVRIDGAQTIAVSGSVSAAAARFHTAATDGSVAFFSIEETTSPLDDNLYRFEVDTETPTLIAEDALGVMGASEDASRLYFTSEQVLDGGAVAGEPNFYLYEAGEPPTYTFIAQLDERAASGSSAFSPTSDRPVGHASRVSPDGQFVAFMSQAPLTGYDNTDVGSGEADAEVFLYSAPSEELVCVSCNPSGARPAGRDVGEEENAPPVYWAAARIPAWTNQLFAPRPLSDDGSRLFFEGFEALVPRDTNAKQDVYEWTRAPDKAACEAIGAELFVEDSGGCLSLISSGQSPQDSHFVDATPSGSDVFFKTGSSLLPHDPGLIDIYDARVEGGLPVPVPPKPPCQGEACQSPPPPPQDLTPSSSSYQGPGSPEAKPKPKRCPKGKRKVKVKGKVRCVPKKRKGKAAKANRSRGASR